MIILIQYSENYSFIYQDTIHSIHYDTIKSTLHLIVIYINVNSK